MSDAVRIISTRMESKDTKTFEFQWNKDCRPGQFIMVWIPGVDEIPMSLSSTGDVKSITVKAIGDATRKLHELNENDLLHIRGPYGNGFTPFGKVLVVAGGVGMAAVMPVIRETSADVVFGARNSDEIIFEKEASSISNIHISTDDGSRGFHGNAVQLAMQLCDSTEYDMIIGCGPEVMLFYLHKACTERNIMCQLSLERHMKCGTGICGACMMDEHRVCADGPVFTGEQISKMNDFGKRKRNASGAIIPL